MRTQSLLLIAVTSLGAGCASTELTTPDATQTGAHALVFEVLSPATTEAASGVAIADLDGDGKLDLVVSVGSDLQVLRGKGDGTFTAGQRLAGTFRLGRLQSADFDGDGKPDLASASPAGGSDPAQVYRNVSGQLQAGVSLGADSSGATDLAVGDLDGDGKPDIATAHINEGKLGLFLNTGAAFASHGLASWPASQGSLALCDVDGDGKLDVVTAGPGSSFPNVFMGKNTGGQFAAAAPLGGAIWPTGVAAGDFRGDGLVDVVTANSNDSNVSWFERGADGAWSSHALAGPNNARETLAKDLDGDGVADLVMAYGNYGQTARVMVYRQKAPLSTVTLPGVNGTAQLAAADLNGDGKVDLVAASEDGVVVVLAK